jgi:transcriptional regulator GlxA family with amidase domain
MKKNESLIPTGGIGQRTIVIVGYDGIELLDATGPIEVFETVNKCMRENGDAGPTYAISILSESPGVFATSSGLKLIADAAWHDCPEEIDTLIVVGSTDQYLDNALANKNLVGWLRDTGSRARRLVSVCTGAFLLAEAGLLDGRHATTHWMYVERLRDKYPRVAVEPDAIFVRDGSVSTSAGVTTCMDLALSLVEEDFGRKTALSVARRLVLYLKRPGGQTQFSTHLRAQMAVDGPLGQLLAWLEENVHLKVKVEELADRAAMSPRNFARTFVRETGMTPARYIDRIRLERAIHLLEDTSHRIETVALESGFASAEQLRRTFQRHMGITPLAYRERF